MLNLFLGLPRHVWLSPYDIPPSSSICSNYGNPVRNISDKKMENPTNLTNTSTHLIGSSGDSTSPSSVGSTSIPAISSGVVYPTSGSSTSNSPPTTLAATQSFSSMVSQAIQSLTNNSRPSILPPPPQQQQQQQQQQQAPPPQQQQQPPLQTQPQQSQHSHHPHHHQKGSGGKFQCKMCNLIFLHKSAMQLHAKEVHRGELKPFQCQQCLKSFSSHHQLGQHNRIHTGEKPYKCNFCDKCFKQLSHLQQHIRLHTGERPYKCSVPNCGRSFIQLANLQQHLRNHDNQSKNRPYHCDICGKGFVAEVSLMTHMTTQHALMSGQGLLPCTVCHHLFASREMLAEHIHSKH